MIVPIEPVRSRRGRRQQERETVLGPWFRGHEAVELAPRLLGRNEFEIRVLLEKGADPYAEADDGTNALWAAAGGGGIRNLILGPKLGTCFPDTIRILREAAPDLRLRKSISTATPSSKVLTV